MKKIVLLYSFALLVDNAIAQNTFTPVDSTRPVGRVTIIKDSRLDELAKIEAAFNEDMAAKAKTTARGYRLMLLSTNDRVLAMKVRTQLLQRYPEQKVYMSFQPPYIKLKFGNFLDKEEAEDYRNEILKNKLVTSNIYLSAETIEVKPDKNKDSMQ